MSGHPPTDFETSWDTAEEFVDELNEALSRDAATIRETELDPVGGFREAYLEFLNEEDNRISMVFVDRLGRFITPACDPYSTLSFVTFEGETQRRTVVRRETRYEGDQETAFVHYPESLEESDGNS